METQQGGEERLKNQKLQESRKEKTGLPASQKGTTLCPGLLLGAKIILWLASYNPSPLHLPPHLDLPQPLRKEAAINSVFL